MIDILRDSKDWWWVHCDCGHVEGPFDAEDDAHDAAHEHDCVPVTTERQGGA